MNLFDALLDLARRLTTTREGTATAVNVAYIDDTTKTLGVDEYKAGTLFLKAATPKTLTITANTANRVSFATQPAAPAAGVGYAIINRDYPLDVLMSAVNASIKDLHAAIAEDETLDTDRTVDTYTLPAGVSDLLRVDVETPIPNAYYGPGATHFVQHHSWHEVDGELRFVPGAQPMTDDLAIRLTYRVRPDDLDDAADELPMLDYELLLWKATAHALRWGLQKYGQDPDRRVVDRLNEAQQEIARRGGNKRTYQKAVRVGHW
jgi:hypothetical protein